MTGVTFYPMYSGIIYKATNPQNSRAFIGASMLPMEQVMLRHISASLAPNPKSLFHIELRDYGKTTPFEWVILKMVTGESRKEVQNELKRLTPNYIHKHRTDNRCFGYNTPDPAEKRELCKRKPNAYYAIYHLEGYNATYVERFPTMQQAKEAYGRRLNLSTIDKRFAGANTKVIKRNNPDADYVAVRYDKTQRHPKTLRIRNEILRVENRHLRGEDKLPNILFTPPKRARKTGSLQDDM